MPTSRSAAAASRAARRRSPQVSLSSPKLAASAVGFRSARSQNWAHTGSSGMSIDSPISPLLCAKKGSPRPHPPVSSSAPGDGASNTWLPKNTLAKCSRIPERHLSNAQAEIPSKPPIKHVAAVSPKTTSKPSKSGSSMLIFASVARLVDVVVVMVVVPASSTNHKDTVQTRASKTTGKHKRNENSCRETLELSEGRRMRSKRPRALAASSGVLAAASGCCAIAPQQPTRV
mmetsp:Transcript_33822/g.110578  ORF Transcript_33822/g.110578 Transcript_33822/m.110578 type:complete len:231 (-) Transcript_33822:6-698(-)